MRLAAAPVTPAFQAPTIVRIRPNAITAVAIPTMVSAVRRRCRNRFLNTSRRSFTAGPSLQFALVQVAYEVRALGGVRVVRHHHDGLLEFLVQPLEQREHLFGGLAVEVPRRLVRHEDRGIGGDGPRDRHPLDRKSTRLNSSHANISYAVFCLKKKKKDDLRAELVTG